LRDAFDTGKTESGELDIVRITKVIVFVIGSHGDEGFQQLRRHAFGREGGDQRAAQETNEK